MGVSISRLSRFLGFFAGSFAVILTAFTSHIGKFTGMRQNENINHPLAKVSEANIETGFGEIDPPGFTTTRDERPHIATVTFRLMMRPQTSHQRNGTFLSRCCEVEDHSFGRRGFILSSVSAPLVPGTHLGVLSLSKETESRFLSFQCTQMKEKEEKKDHGFIHAISARAR
jgi:hypothetical protein